MNFEDLSVYYKKPFFNRTFIRTALSMYPSLFNSFFLKNYFPGFLDEKSVILPEKIILKEDINSNSLFDEPTA